MKQVKHQNPDASIVLLTLADGASIFIGKEVTLGSDITVVGHCAIGNNTEIGYLASLNNVTIGQNVKALGGTTMTGLIPDSSYLEANARVSLWKNTKKTDQPGVYVKAGGSVSIKDISYMTNLVVGVDCQLVAHKVVGDVRLNCARSVLDEMELLDNVHLDNHVVWHGRKNGLHRLSAHDEFLSFCGKTMVIHNGKLYNGDGVQKDLPLLRQLMEVVARQNKRAKDAEGRLRVACKQIAELQAQQA